MRDLSYAEQYAVARKAVLPYNGCGTGKGDDRVGCRWDIAEAIYWWSCDHHGGMYSDTYAAITLSRYTPGGSTKPTTEGAMEAYAALCREAGCGPHDKDEEEE